MDKQSLHFQHTLVQSSIKVLPFAAYQVNENLLFLRFRLINDFISFLDYQLTEVGHTQFRQFRNRLAKAGIILKRQDGFAYFVVLWLMPARWAWRNHKQVCVMRKNQLKQTLTKITDLHISRHGDRAVL